MGQDHDPAQFGSQPPHIRVERYIPQAAVLPHCAAVIAHGGWNTTMGTLAQGLPTVFLPISADQPLNAACCAALGVGVVLDAGQRTPEMIRGTVLAVLSDPTYRQNAEQLRDAMAALPGPNHAVALLERLAIERRPQLLAPETP